MLPLTARQEEILQLIDQRMSLAEIGLALGISVHTVQTHVDRAMDRLGLLSQEHLRLHLLKKRMEKKMRELGVAEELIVAILEVA